MDRLIEKNNLFIFDLDDTIVKTEKYHYDAWILTLQQFVKKDFYINYGDFCLKFHSKIENSIKTYLVNELNLSNKRYIRSDFIVKFMQMFKNDL